MPFLWRLTSGSTLYAQQVPTVNDQVARSLQRFEPEIWLSKALLTCWGSWRNRFGRVCLEPVEQLTWKACGKIIRASPHWHLQMWGTLPTLATNRRFRLLEGNRRRHKIGAAHRHPGTRLLSPKLSFLMKSGAKGPATWKSPSRSTYPNRLQDCTDRIQSIREQLLGTGF